MAEIDRLLRIAFEKRASDLHLSAGEPVRLRIDGDLVPLDDKPFDDEALQKELFEILSEGERKKCLATRNLDKSYGVEGCGFFRVNIFWTRRGVASVMRSIPFAIPTLQDLALPPAVQKLAEAPKGLVLVTGPTGSGKSTTLAAMINYINTNFQYHILTAEDPVEFVHESKRSLINQREIGSNCPTFADALKYALREDPDVILVGEMRDLETIALALTAAETGHLVFGTLHTRGAGSSVDRIIDSFPANQQAMIRTMLAESLVGVISQSLVKRADKNGRVAAFEILIVNHAISNLIREGKTFQMSSIIQTGRKDGMILMEQHLLELVEKGIVSIEEASAHVDQPTGAFAKAIATKAIANRSVTSTFTAASTPTFTPPLTAASKAPPSIASRPMTPSTKPKAKPPMPSSVFATPNLSAQKPNPAPAPAVVVQTVDEVESLLPDVPAHEIDPGGHMMAESSIPEDFNLTEDLSEDLISPASLDDNTVPIQMNLMSEEDQVTEAMNLKVSVANDAVDAPNGTVEQVLPPLKRPTPLPAKESKPAPAALKPPPAPPKPTPQTAKVLSMPRNENEPRPPVASPAPRAVPKPPSAGSRLPPPPSISKKKVG